ncbi:hypothetical protein [Pseudonocardia spinosispora]|uniref:hypothetical protein n=1 Tax=Pseudonocardia spinosispora TaxID=103441 RepID=UPI000490E116|nr:hypothetical protein [Pseudonocardia spinosispora]
MNIGRSHAVMAGVLLCACLTGCNETSTDVKAPAESTSSPATRTTVNLVPPGPSVKPTVSAPVTPNSAPR